MFNWDEIRDERDYKDEKLRDYCDLIDLLCDDVIKKQLVQIIRKDISESKDYITQREINYNALKMSNVLECVMMLDSGAIYLSDLVNNDDAYLVLLQLEAHDYINIVMEEDSIKDIQLTVKGEAIKKLLNM